MKYRKCSISDCNNEARLYIGIYSLRSGNGVSVRDYACFEHAKDIGNSLINSIIEPMKQSIFGQDWTGK